MAVVSPTATTAGTTIPVMASNSHRLNPIMPPMIAPNVTLCPIIIGGPAFLSIVSLFTCNLYNDMVVFVIGRHTVSCIVRLIKHPSRISTAREHLTTRLGDGRVILALLFPFRSSLYYPRKLIFVYIPERI